MGEQAMQAESAVVQMAQSASFHAGAGGNLHPIGAQFRLPSDMNGDDRMVPWRVDINEDSGSNVQTITTEMWSYLNIHRNLAPPLTDVILADGSMV